MAVDETSGPIVCVGRHGRQIMLREWGGAGQQRATRATVALVGVGALGSAAGLYLAAAGIGRLIVIDNDRVELSNLQRQILFATADVGRPKAEAAATRLQALDPACRVEIHDVRLDRANAADLLAQADIVLDGSDSFETRFAVNQACVALNIPLVSGAVGRWNGQVGVFCSGGAMFASQSDVPCYRCWVPELPPDGTHCATTGVIGALPGLTGAQMALQALKLVSGAGQPLLGRVWLHDSLADTTRIVQLRRDPACPACGDRTCR
jgi:molybdopterin-synthase adenylyltransferase